MKAETEITPDSRAVESVGAKRSNVAWGALLPLLLIAATVIVLDRISKLLILDAFGLQADVHVQQLIPGWLQLRYVENTGAAFGLFKGGNWFLALIALAVAAAIVYAAPRMHQESAGAWARWPALIALALVLGGALGNLIDRIIYGYVVDFIDCYGLAITWDNRRYQFAVFNVADSAISVGIVLLLITMLFAGKKEPAQSKG